MSATHLLDIQSIVVGYGPVEALHGVSLHIDRGEIVALIGANGAGKSTLMMSIFGSPAIREGSISFNGQTIHRLPTHRIGRLGIAIAPEGRRIFPAMSIEDNLRMGSLANPGRFAASRARAFELFPRLAERRQQSAGTLSGGEQQMLAIARALMSEPQLLLLDEPSLGLAPIIVQQIFAVLREIANSGVTIFLVEQNAHHALKLSDRAYVLTNGRITLHGSGEALLKNTAIREAYLGGHSA